MCADGQSQAMAADAPGVWGRRRACEFKFAARLVVVVLSEKT